MHQYMYFICIYAYNIREDVHCWRGRHARVFSADHSRACPAFHSILKMAWNYNIPYIFYTLLWASEVKNHLPSENLDLSQAAGQWICQAHALCSEKRCWRRLNFSACIACPDQLIHRKYRCRCHYLSSLAAWIIGRQLFSYLTLPSKITSFVCRQSDLDFDWYTIHPFSF